MPPTTHHKPSQDEIAARAKRYYEEPAHRSDATKNSGFAPNAIWNPRKRRAKIFPGLGTPPFGKPPRVPEKSEADLRFVTADYAGVGANLRTRP